MAEQTVTIPIRVTGSPRKIRETRNELLKLAAAGQAADKRLTGMNKSFRSLDMRTRRMIRSMERFGKMLTGLNKMLAKVFVIGFGLAAAAIASVNALFAVGRATGKAFTVVMQGLAVATAAVGAAMTAAAAAMREYTAAVNAYAYKSSPALNGRLSESTAALRGLYNDANLAVFGIQSLNQAFAAVSKNTQFNAQSRQLLRGLADFASAGGDPAQNFAAAAEFVGLLQKAGKIDNKAVAAAQGIGPTFVKALEDARKQGVSSLSSFMEMLNSGELARLGGVEGQAEIVGGTVFAQFKKMLTEIMTFASDIGQSLLQPLKEAMGDISLIIQRLFYQVGPELVKFGQGSFLSGLIGAIQKLSDWTVALFRDYLPGATGMVGRFTAFWEKLVYVYRNVVNTLRPMTEYGRVVIESLGPFVKELFGRTGILLEYIGKKFRDNRDDFIAFGERLREVVITIGDVAMFMVDTFVMALPALNSVLDAFNNIVASALALLGVIRSLAVGFGNLFGGNGSFGALAMMGSLGLAGAGLRGYARNVRMGRGMGVASIPGIGGIIAGRNQRAATGQPGLFGRLTGRARGPMYGPPAPSPYLSARQGGAGRLSAAGTAMAASSRGFRAARPGMGAGLAMGLATPFVSEGAQGFMAGGATIASMAPFLGAAGPYALAAGIGLGGYGMMMNGESGGEGALGGAMAGGALGATLGSFIPVIGTVLGGVLGAGVGAAIGFFKGQSNARKKEAREAVDDYMKSQFQGISEGFFRGDSASIQGMLDQMRADLRSFEIVNQAFFSGRGSRATERENLDRLVRVRQQAGRGGITQAQADMIEGANTDTLEEELRKQVELTESVVEPMLSRFNDGVSLLERATGKTTDEIFALAQEMNVNLFDDTREFADVVRELGLAVEQTAERIIGASRDLAIDGFQGLLTVAQQAESGLVIDELTEALFQDLQAGDVSQSQLAKYANDLFNQLNIMSPDTPIENIRTFMELVGPDGTLFREGAQLEGMGNRFLQLGLRSFGAEQLDLQRDLMVDQIAQQMLFQGYAVDRAEIAGIVGGMSGAELEAAQNAMVGGALSNGLAPRSSLAGVLGQGVSVESLDLATMTIDEKLALFGEEGVAIMEGMNKVIEAGFQDRPDWMKDPPDWFTTESFTALVEAVNNGDTSTPRGDTTSSRLGQTLSAHNYFNSQLAGRRSITSAFRTTNLGSINSDHVTGRAYDLVGDNLGAYATMINKSGGFAEFHGTGGSRHLHVVPNTGGPQGDATATRTTVAVPQSSGGVAYNVTINAQPGQDPEQIAAAVMRKIETQQRSMRERM